MKNRYRGWIIIAAVILVSGAAIWTVDLLRSRVIGSKDALLGRLPKQDSLLVCIDFGALRRAGLVDLLATSRTPEDPEYTEFVNKTDFDYKQDLDLVMASFGPAGKYFLLTGRFDWNRLYGYAKAQGGDCYNAKCQMTGSVPEKKISFFPLRPQIMALAVAKDGDAVDRLVGTPASAKPATVPADPFWVSFPGSLARQTDSLPTGTAIFAKAVQEAEEVVLSIGPSQQEFQASLMVNCRTASDAAALARELENDTNLLRSLIAREHQTPNPDDLSGVLTAGVFRAEDRRVAGHWPISKTLVRRTLTGGS